MNNQRLNPGSPYTRYKINSVPERRGLSFPLELDGNGGLKTSIDSDLTREHILSVLTTLPHERVMRQSYGLPNQVLNAAEPDLVDLQIRRSLEEEVQEVESFQVESNSTLTDLEAGLYGVNVYWTYNGKIEPPLSITLEK